MSVTIKPALQPSHCVNPVVQVPKKPPTEQIRVDPAFAKRVRTLAEFLGKSAGEYIAERLGPILDKDVAEMAKALTAKKPATKD